MQIKVDSNNTYNERMQRLVSIVIVTFNAGMHLKECINSILNQTNQDYEILIFDGKSTDNTISILNEYNEKIAYWQSEPDAGIYDAMNKAIPFCKGNWILFLGADDRLLHGFSIALSKLKNNDIIYYGNCVTNVELYGGKFSAYKLSKRNICQQGIFYPYEVFKKYNFDISYPVYADYLLNIQCWGDSSFKKIHFPISIASYNLTGYSSVANDSGFKKDKGSLIRKHLGKWVYFRYLFRKLKSQRKGDTGFFLVRLKLKILSHNEFNPIPDINQLYYLYK